MATEQQNWLEQNNAYLASVLQWLRIRLSLLANNEPESGASLKLWRGNNPRTKELEKATVQMQQAAQIQPSPALLFLAQQFGLSRFEQEILLLCAAIEFDTSIAALCAEAQQNAARPYPTFALALALFDEPNWEALSPESPLRYWNLIAVNQTVGQPLILAPLHADERIVNFIKGLNYLDGRLLARVSPLQLYRTSISQSHQVHLATIVRYLQTAASGSDLPLIQMVGVDAFSKQQIIAAVASVLNLVVYRLPAALLPSQIDELEHLIRLLQRESLLQPFSLYIDMGESTAQENSEQSQRPIKHLLDRSGMIIFVDTFTPLTGTQRPTVILDINKPTTTEQYDTWLAMLGDNTHQLAAQLSSQFDLNIQAIEQIVNVSAAEEKMLWQACCDYTRPRLDVLAQRIEPRATWHDLVLPEEQLHLLQQITSQIRHRSVVYEQWGFGKRMNRGKGISALFAGESGTGKTMAAEVMANELHLNLYRIDLSSVVSKYIGETEKNLRRLFDAAEDGGAILFFDEADALFGKRSEVKDSHDRYANIEINYLLQRIEAYRGLAILATNMKLSLDSAFLRRLRFVIDFPFPGSEQRKQIWMKALPPELPTRSIDYDYLAQLNITGGNIHSIVLNAAFMAAAADSPLTMNLLLDAARMEYNKLERTYNSQLFATQANGVRP